MIGNPVDKLTEFSSFSSAKTNVSCYKTKTNAKGSSAARTVSPVATEWIKSLLYKVMIIVMVVVMTITR